MEGCGVPTVQEVEVQRVVLVAQEHSPRRDDGTQDPPPTNDWTAQVQALAANPAWAQEQFAQWQYLRQQYQHLPLQLNTFHHNSSSWRRRQWILGACFPRTDPLGTGGVWTRERIGLLCNRPIQHIGRVKKHESSTGLEW